MAQMNEFRFQSKNAQIAAGIHNARRNLRTVQGFDRAIDRKPFGDAAKIDNHGLSKSNRAILFENNVAPVPLAYISILSRKILPLHQPSRDRDVENAVS